MTAPSGEEVTIKANDTTVKEFKIDAEQAAPGELRGTWQCVHRAEAACPAVDRMCVDSIAWLCLAAAARSVPAPPRPRCPSHLLLAAAAVGQAQTGTIKGRLVWGDEKIPDQGAGRQGPVRPKMPTCVRHGPIMSRDLVVDPKTKGVAYGFAYLSSPRATAPSRSRHCWPRPRRSCSIRRTASFSLMFLPFHKDQKLVIKSSDPVGHNVRFTRFNNTGVNTMVAPNGQFAVNPNLAAETRPMKLQCDIHNWMTGYLLVLDHPFFATTARTARSRSRMCRPASQN